MDILIYAKPEKVEHKMKEYCDDDTNCYWGKKTPSEDNLSMIRKVYFSDGKRIYAEGNFLNHLLEPFSDKRKYIGIWFSPLKRISLKQPKKPPTRGWCYINK